ncbi:RNA polymerase sigma factor [Solitalea koreensis]|uniref:RNA polymerase sigma-70 factor, ECF subfamily n=1 Tax=Solitalea koreensis TaxID=543615 RepID=A0A521AFV2_9SPHI|nr:RNA polymerase sigma-70 factor [Solitalea koreensis]SMO33667.1 RNA polymerase sigma-70 factor, ECF subfamily [Solitalea koreensis]
MKILEDDLQKQLLTRLKQGDESAFNALYKAYSKPLYLRILRMVKNAEDADELLQELFIKLWDNRRSIDLEKSFQSYMYTIAQNLVYNYFRKIANDQTLIKSLLANATDYYLNAQDLLENKEISILLQRAIDQLTPQRKQAFQLCKIEGKSYEETAALMGISTATVNSHMTKSFQSIKDYLLEHQNVYTLLFIAYMVAGIG